MQSAMESCPVKSLISGGMGFALGGAFGLFMSSVRIERRITLIHRLHSGALACSFADSITLCLFLDEL